jgi:hypothetical protein
MKGFSSLRSTSVRAWCPCCGFTVHQTKRLYPWFYRCVSDLVKYRPDPAKTLTEHKPNIQPAGCHPFRVLRNQDRAPIRSSPGSVTSASLGTSGTPSLTPVQRAIALAGALLSGSTPILRFPRGPSRLPAASPLTDLGKSQLRAGPGGSRERKGSRPLSFQIPSPETGSPEAPRRTFFGGSAQRRRAFGGRRVSGPPPAAYSIARHDDGTTFCCT